MNPKPVLVTGPTGYVGGRLVPKLLDAGYRVRAMARSLAKMSCRPWAHHPHVELMEGDVLDLVSLQRATSGCWAAFYLVHSMNPQHKDFTGTDRAAARNMVAAAAAADLERIIYLGGLGEVDNPYLSKHLQSRHEVAAILQAGPVPTTYLRAAMILGSGSASFEILRYLVERLPVMITPRWVRSAVQPIAITNVLEYLQGCLEHAGVVGQTLDIGGPEVLTYQDLIRIYAQEAGLRKRLILPVPLLTPTLSAYWIHLVTPLPAAIARPLAEGLAMDVICRDNRIGSIIPQQLLSCRRAIRLALERLKQQQVATCWSDAGSIRPPEWTACGDAPYAGGTIFECGYRIRMHATPEQAWKPIASLGGETGWYAADYLWYLRGALDKLMGGIGLRRGRRHPTELYPGDALDCWRVLKVDPPRHLLLLAEMKLPGQAVLEFRVSAINEEETEIQQLSRFLPKGLGGILYWYALYPFHQWIFTGMLSAMGRRVGTPIRRGPERFTPKLQRSCRANTSGD